MTYVWITLIVLGIGFGVVLGVKAASPKVPKLEQATDVIEDLALDLSGENSRHAKDNIRVDVRLRIRADLSKIEDTILRSAKLRDSLEEGYRVKTTEAVAKALKLRLADEALKKPNELLDAIVKAFGDDPHGAEVSFEIDYIALTPESFYDHKHILDSAGLRLLIERRTEAELKENAERRKRKLEEARRRLEVEAVEPYSRVLDAELRDFIVEDSSLEEVIEFLRSKMRESDQEGVSILSSEIDPGKIPGFTHRERETTVGDLLKKLANHGEVVFHMTSVGIVITEPGVEPFPNSKAKAGEVYQRIAPD